MNYPLRTMNTALVSRGLLPMDGHCICGQCDIIGLDRDQMCDPQVYGRQICKKCRDLLLAGYIKCRECNGSGGSVRVADYVRGDRTEFCIRCDGDGRVYVGVPKWLERVHGETCTP